MWTEMMGGKKGLSLSCVQLFATSWTVARQAPLFLRFSGKNTGVDCHFLLLGILPTQGSNPCLLLGRWILYHWATCEAPQMWYILLLTLPRNLGIMITLRWAQTQLGPISFWLIENNLFILHLHSCGGLTVPEGVILGFPAGSAGKESACNVGDLGLIPGLGRSPGEENGYPLQYSDLENLMNCVVHRVAKSRTQLSDFHSLTHKIYWRDFSKWKRKGLN